MTTVNEAHATTASVLARSGGTQTLGKDDFLKLLVTQLQNQDPLNPSDPTEFTAQLAQFSSLEQLFSVNASLERMAAASGDMERLSALSLIGTEVTATGGRVRLGSEPVQIGYRLEGAAQEVTVHLLDDLGRTVAGIPARQTAMGEHFFSWDGKNQHGDPVPPGEYQLVISARAGKDEVIPSSPLTRGTVTGVNLGEGGSVLVTTAGDYRLREIRRVDGV